MGRSVLRTRSHCQTPVRRQTLGREVVNLLFDLDGTLMDPMHGFRASLDFAFAQAHLPLPSDEVLRRAIGPPMHISLTTLMGVPPTKLAEVLESFRQHQMREGLQMYQFYPGALEVLRDLGSAHRLFVATSKPEPLTRPLLEHFNATSLFVGIYGSELNGERSNKAELIEYLLRQEKLRSQDCIMFGDREYDMRGAKLNGVRACGVTWGYGNPAELIEAGAERLFDHWPEIAQWVHSL
jgi:phosphoglycolate phosphatase